jgi:CRP-like cAMP-binding protein
MTNRLTRKLEAFGPLPDADRRLLDEVCREARAVGPKIDLIREGDAPSDVHLILEGFACRYKVLPNGTRQIMAFLVPGDFCDLHVFILKAMDHTIATLSPCKVVKIPRARILEMMDRPAIARAFWWAALVDEATLREWLVNIGARTAEQRIAHLLCELLLRLQTVGLADSDRYELPITQAELADTVSLTSVYVNRVVQRLRRNGLIAVRGKILVILDVERLKAFSGFNPNYLHLSGQSGIPEQSL